MPSYAPLTKYQALMQASVHTHTHLHTHTHTHTYTYNFIRICLRNATDDSAAAAADDDDDDDDGDDDDHDDDDDDDLYDRIRPSISVCQAPQKHNKMAIGLIGVSS